MTPNRAPMTHSPTIHVVALGLDVGMLAHLDRELGSQFSVTVASSPVDAMTALIAMPMRSAIITEVDFEPFGGNRRGVAFLRLARYRAPRSLRILVTRRIATLDDASVRDVDAVFTVPWAEGTLRRYLAWWSSADDDGAGADLRRGET